MSALLAPTYFGTFKFADRAWHADIFSSKHTSKGLRLITTYAIKCERTGHTYVGATQDFFRRWGAHQWMLIKGEHTNPDLQALYDTWGEDAFTISIVQHLDSTEGLELREQAAADQFKPEMLLNYRIGNTCKAGWAPRNHAGLRPYEPKTKRRPNSVARWFDFTSMKHGVCHA